MGSLLPGWDERAPGLPPKDMEDYTDDSVDAHEGYFARLERVRSLRRTSSGASANPPPLGRTSSLSRPSLDRPSPPDGTSLAPHLLNRASLDSASSYGLRRPSLEGSRASLEGSRHSLDRAASGRLGGRNASLPVDWEDGCLFPASFDSSDPTSPRTPSALARVDSGGVRPSRSTVPATVWWDKMGAACLNERPDMEERPQRGYTPQFAVTGQAIHYRGVTTVGGAAVAAGAAPDGAGELAVM